MPPEGMVSRFWAIAAPFKGILAETLYHSVSRIL